MALANTLVRNSNNLLCYKSNLTLMSEFTRENKGAVRVPPLTPDVTLTSIKHNEGALLKRHRRQRAL